MILLLYKAIPRPVRSFGALMLGKCLGRRWFWDLESLVKPRDSILSGCTDEAEFDATGQRDAAFIQSLDLIDAESTTLHIGCGMGRIEKFLAEHVSAAHGIDISRVMIHRAHRYARHPRAHFHVNNGQDLAMFAADTFDCVYSFLVFQHFSKDIALQYLREIHRTLKPGGHFLCQYQYKAEDETVPEPDPSHPWGIRLYSERDIRDMADTAPITIDRFLNLDEVRQQRQAGAPHAECNLWVVYRKPDTHSTEV